MSSVVEFQWGDVTSKGRPWQESILYERHVGTFTPEGSFIGVEKKLDYLSDWITAIELMPVAHFSGKFNWGYDGVLLYAPDSTYGYADDFAWSGMLIGRGSWCSLMWSIINSAMRAITFMSTQKKHFFIRIAHTPWGPAINFSGNCSRTVRDFFIHNVLYWLEEFQLDGLRFDAVNRIIDDSPRHNS